LQGFFTITVIHRQSWSRQCGAAICVVSPSGARFTVSEIFLPETPNFAANAHRALLEVLRSRSSGVYLGHDERGWCFTAPEHSVMVLGPPRSGKTTSLIIPNVLAATGAVVSTSTKPDVVEATVGVRADMGRCLVFDPTASTAGRTGLPEVRWSPLQSCTTWLGSLSAAQSLVATGGPGGAAGDRRPEHSHWTERAEALLAPLLHAAAVEGGDMRTVLTWVDRRLALPAQQILSGQPGRATELARNLLDGIVSTDERELSGIWSTASGALGGFRSHEALRATADPTFDPVRFVRSSDTVYIAAPAHRQSLVAPMVVGLIEDIRRAAYVDASHTDPGAARRPVLLALDELANIAPLPDLPAMVSEGGGQGVTTLACFQDLTQARRRWPVHADGFPSLFGTTVVLPGIGDVRTLDSLSQLAGDEEVPTRTVSAGRSLGDHPVVDLVTGGRPHVSESLSTQWRRRLPVDVLAHGAPGHAVAFDERNQPSWVPLAPSHHTEPWRTLRGPGHEIGRTMEADPRARDRAIPRPAGHDIER
jgi:type IV secretion system protein VirD4